MIPSAKQRNRRGMSDEGVTANGETAAQDGSASSYSPTNANEIEKVRRDLVQEMKITKGCRFNASKRLERRDKRMITITAFASYR